MRGLKTVAIETKLIEQMRATMLSPGYGHPVSVNVATGHGPCRYCLQPFVVGQDRRLLFTFNSFEGIEGVPQPGPVFVHERTCERYAESGAYPEKLRKFGAVLDAYDASQRIVCRAVELEGRQEESLQTMFDDPAIRYVMVRDAKAGCYDFRVDRENNDE